MITLAFDQFYYKSRPDGTLVLNFHIGALTPEQLGELAKLHNKVGCLGVTLEDDFNDTEKEVLNKAIELSKEAIEKPYTGVIKGNAVQ